MKIDTASEAERRTDSDWFVVEQIDATTFAISEYGHWENFHSYLLIGDERAALVDTGLGIDDIAAIVASLTDLPVTVVTTHAHFDHTGGHAAFDEVLIHRLDADWLENGIPIPLEQVRATMAQEPLRKTAPVGFSFDSFVPFTGKPSRLLDDGDIVELGGRELTTIHTPGHSPGHICLHEPARGYLFSGDLVYKGRLDAFYPSTDPVAFAKSVRRVDDLPNVERVLPSHHDINVTPEDLHNIREAFDALDEQDKLRHGSGLHEFDGFSIKL